MSQMHKSSYKDKCRAAKQNEKEKLQVAVCAVQSNGKCAYKAAIHRTATSHCVHLHNRAFTTMLSTSPTTLNHRDGAFHLHLWVWQSTQMENIMCTCGIFGDTMWINMFCQVWHIKSLFSKNCTDSQTSCAAIKLLRGRNFPLFCICYTSNEHYSTCHAFWCSITMKVWRSF